MGLCDKRSRFGLGDLLLSPEQQRAILADMGWDGTELTEEGASIPYKLEKEWFANTLTTAIEAAVQRYQEAERATRRTEGRHHLDRYRDMHHPSRHRLSTHGTVTQNQGE